MIINRLITLCERDNPDGVRNLGNAVKDRSVFFFIRKYKLRSADNICFSVGKLAARPLCFRGERCEALALYGTDIICIIRDCLQRGVYILTCVMYGRKRGFYLCFVCVYRYQI